MSLQKLNRNVLGLGLAYSHLYRVVQGRGCWVEGEVLEGLDLWCLPSVFLRPIDGQHVIGELLAEQQL